MAVSSKQKKETLAALKDKRDLALKWRKSLGWDERSERSYRYYQFGMDEDFSNLDNKRDKRKANYVFSNIESMIPGMFDKVPSFQVLGRGSEDHAKAPLVEEILKYKMEHMDLEEKLEDAVRDQLVRSMGYLKVTWDTQVVENKENEIEGVERDDIKIEVLNPLNVWITAGDHRMEDAEGIFEKVVATPEEVKAKYSEDLEPDHFLTDTEKKDRKEGRVALWEYHGRLDGKLKRWVFTDKKILAELDFYQHGQKPYIEFPNYRMSDEFYPWSEIYQMEPLQEELIEIDNQSSEFRKRAINPKKIVKKGVLDDINMFRIKDPRVNVVEVNEIGQIHWEEPGLIGQDLYNMRAIKKEDISLMTGQNELSRGGTEETVRTATGQQILFNASQGRIRQKVRIMERALRQLLIQTQGLLAQFQDSEEQVRITEQNENPFAKYTKEDIQGRFDFVIDIVDTMPILRAKRGQLALQAFELLNGDPDIDQKALKKKVIKLAFQDINADSLILGEQVGLGGLKLPDVPGKSSLSNEDLDTFAQSLSVSPSQQLQQLQAADVAFV